MDTNDKPRRQKLRGHVPLRHGTLSCYTNNFCRCAECRHAKAEYRREWVARQKALRIAEGLWPAPVAAA